MRVGSLGQQARDSGLAAARRTPQDHRGEAMRRHHAADRALGIEQVGLADDLGQRLGPELVGERLRGLLLEQAVHRTTAVKVLLPRRSTIVQGALLCVSKLLSCATLAILRLLISMIRSPF